MTTCIHCGCTDQNACQTFDAELRRTVVCSWVTKQPDGRLGECSACLADDGLFKRDPLEVGESDLILPGDPDYHL